MKKEEPVYDEAWLRDLEAISPLVKEGFARMDGPSDRVLKAIHDEAVAQSVRRHAPFRFAFYVRFATAAAVLLLLCGVSLQAWRSWSNEKTHHQIVQILRITTQDPNGTDDELADTSELATFLLSMQGLDRESYFSSPDGTESLWL